MSEASRLAPIKRATPLAPIPLWPADGHILPEPWRRPEDELTEGSVMPPTGEPIGEHQYCGGVVSWRQTALGFRTVFCKGCGMRFAILPIPDSCSPSVETWGQLRAYCTKTFSRWPADGSDPC